MIPRNHKDDGWELDKVRRWRSKRWRDFVRMLPPVLPEGDGPVIAAHFRYPGCGISIKAADCLVYPLFDGYHKTLHNKGQETDWKQWEWVTSTMVRGLDLHALLATTLAETWIRGLKCSAYERNYPLSTPNIEAVAQEWARLFLDGALCLNKNHLIDF
jgi:hypothetical protein